VRDSIYLRSEAKQHVDTAEDVDNASLVLQMGWKSHTGRLDLFGSSLFQCCERCASNYLNPFHNKRTMLVTIFSSSFLYPTVEIMIFLML